MAKNKNNKMKTNREAKMPNSNMETGKELQNKSSTNMEIAEELGATNKTKKNR